MKVEYQVLFVPQSDGIDEINNTREVVFKTDSRLSSRDEIRRISRQHAAQDGVIDSYALRNYWMPACCEMRVTDVQWDDISELTQWLKDDDTIVSIIQVEDTWKHSVVECQFENEKKRKEMEKKIFNMCGSSFPMRSKEQFMQFTMRAKGNIKTQNLSEAKRVYEEHES